MPSLVKFMDEGTSSPFVARLFFSIMKMRDQVYLLGKENKGQLKDSFDQKFSPIFSSSIASRDAARKTISLIENHSKAILDGRVVEFSSNQTVVVNETIDIELGQAIDAFLDQSVISIKSCLQKMLREEFNLDIGFLFQNDQNFNKGLSSMRQNEGNELSNYLESVRTIWLSKFIDLRNDHEHHGLSLEKLDYIPISNGGLSVKLPNILDLPINQFTKIYGNRILLFIENMMVYALFRGKEDFFSIYIYEIPNEKRDPSFPERFRFVPTGLQDLPKWKIDYFECDDFI